MALGRRKLFGDRQPKPAPVLARPRSSGRDRWSTQSSQSAKPKLRVTEVKRETADTVSIALVPEDGNTFRFQPGQYLTFRVPVRTADGEIHWLNRPYSLACHSDGESLRIAVKHVPEGQASGYLNTELEVGTILEAAGPAGEFTPSAARAGQSRFLMVAGGVGITPIFGILSALLASDKECAIRLLYCCRSSEDVIFGQELEKLVSDSRLDLTVRTDSRDGILDSASLAEFAAGWLDAEGTDFDAYICGPSGLMEMSENLLRERGLSQHRIHSERFLAARTAERPDTPQPVRFVRSGIEVMQEPGETILQTGLRAGLDLPFSCTMGGCAHCRQRCVKGTGIVMDEPNCLTPAEVEAGDFLACCSYATGAVEIDA